MKKITSLLLILFVYACQDKLPDQTPDLKDKIIIGKKVSITSKILNEDREVFISLPSNYDRNIHSYPLIIVMDAEYLFEITSSIVKIKASRNEMPESIVVGIPNNSGKRSDMALELVKSDGQKFFGNHGGMSKVYLDFLRKEIYPFVEENYRVNSHRSIIGMSPSFGPVLEALWTEPDFFNGYIILAAELSLKTKSDSTVSEKILATVESNLNATVSIYIGKAGDDLKRRPAEEERAFAEMNAKLDSIANPNVDFKVEILENEEHYGMSISGIKRGLETIYPSSIWKIPYRDFWNSENPVQAIKLFYSDLSDQYGFDIIPLEDSFYAAQTLLGTLRRLERQKRYGELKEVLKYAMALYPNSKELKEFIAVEN